MNKTLPTIAESPEQLQRSLKSETEAKKRLRLQALYLLASGQARSRAALAALLAVHRHTLRAGLTRYEEGGLAALLTIRHAPGKPSALSPAVFTQLQERLAQPQGFASYGEIQRYLAHDHRLHLSYSTVHALVRYKLKAKPKSPRRSHPKKTLQRSASSNKHSRHNS